jgi:putative ABC transport system permease protein
MEGIRLIVLGGVLGLGAALAAAQLLKSLTFHVAPRDPATYIAVVSLLGLVALAATLIPARAAMRTDPGEALRHE